MLECRAPRRTPTSLLPLAVLPVSPITPLHIAQLLPELIVEFLYTELVPLQPLEGPVPPGVGYGDVQVVYGQVVRFLVDRYAWR